MKKASINYWVDLATGVAFLVCAVTGVLFLFPSVVHTAVGAAPTILFMPALGWHKVHDWSGVVMVAGTALHLALHAKWIANMTRKMFGAPAPAAANRAGRPRPVAQPARAATAAQAATCATPQEDEAAAAAALRRLEELRAERQHEREQRMTRRGFLAGAGAVGGLALLASVGLIGRDAVGEAAATSGGGSSTAGTSGGASTATGDGQASGYGQGSSAGGQSSSSAGSTQVVVNDSACVACGRCMQICPQGVFDWSDSGRAAAQNPGACIRCGRCLQVCPAGAITVSA
jgi:NAD-dependent dihydropyrimidine dehydrogenase PreA subunit